MQAPHSHLLSVYNYNLVILYVKFFFYFVYRKNREVDRGVGYCYNQGEKML